MRVAHLYMPTFLPKICGMHYTLLRLLEPHVNQKVVTQRVENIHMWSEIPDIMYTGKPPAKDPSLVTKLRDWRPDVIHAHDGWAARNHGLDLAEAVGAPLIASLHGSDLLKDAGGTVITSFNRLWREAAAITCNTRFLRKMAITRGCPESKITVIPAGASEALPMSQRSVGEDCHIIAIGRLVPLKGFDRAIKMMAILRLNNPAYQLSIVGDGPERANLEQLVTDLDLVDCVTFYGRLSHADTMHVLSSADILLSCSREMPDGTVEAQGTTIYEAMMMGIPAVAVTVGGVLENIGMRMGDHWGATTVAPRNELFVPNALAHAVVLQHTALTTDTAYTRKRAREYAMDYSLEQSATALLKMYAEVVDPVAV